MDETPPDSTPPDRSHERRQHPRFAAKVEIRFEGEAQAARALRAYSLNLSVGGLCLRTQRDYAVGESLKIHLRVGTEDFELRGEVAWTRGGAIGVRFEGMSEADRARLTEWVAALKR